MPDMPKVLGHAIQVEQVILNLIRNAVEAMSNMPPMLRRLELRTFLEDDMAVVEVRDSGLGLPRETLARILACRAKRWRASLIHSLQPSRPGWEWACRSAGRLLKRMAGRCQPIPTKRVAG